MSFLVLLGTLALAAFVALLAVIVRRVVDRWEQPLELSDADIEASARPLSNVRVVHPVDDDPRL